MLLIHQHIGYELGNVNDEKLNLILVIGDYEVVYYYHELQQYHQLHESI